VLVAAQQQARADGKGLWAETTTTANARTTTTALANDDAGGGGGGSTIVCITKTGTKYHRAGCIYLSKSDITVTLAVAKAKGLGP
jgi:competence protein ComEC